MKYFDDISCLSHTLDEFRKALEPLCFNNYQVLFNSAEKLLEILHSCCFEDIKQTTAQLETMLSSISNMVKTLALPQFDVYTFVNGVSFMDDFVLLSKEAITAAQDIIESSNDKESVIPSKTIESKMPQKEFIVTLLKIICFLLPLLQNHYYHTQDASSSSQEHREVMQYEEQRLELIQEQNNTLDELNTAINLLLDSLNSQEEQSTSAAGTDCPSRFEELPCTGSVSEGDSGNSENSDTTD